MNNVINYDLVKKKLFIQILRFKQFIYLSLYRALLDLEINQIQNCQDNLALLNSSIKTDIFCQRFIILSYQFTIFKQVLSKSIIKGY